MKEGGESRETRRYTNEHTNVASRIAKLAGLYLSQRLNLASIIPLHLSPFLLRFPAPVRSGNSPLSYYSLAVCHCARRTKRHGDGLVALSEIFGNIRMNGRPARQHTAGGKAGIKKQRAEGDRAEARDAGTICSLDRDRDGNHFDCGKKRREREREREREAFLTNPEEQGL